MTKKQKKDVDCPYDAKVRADACPDCRMQRRGVCASTVVPWAGVAVGLGAGRKQRVTMHQPKKKGKFSGRHTNNNRRNRRSRPNVTEFIVSPSQSKDRLTGGNQIL